MADLGELGFRGCTYNVISGSLLASATLLVLVHVKPLGLNDRKTYSPELPRISKFLIKVIPVICAQPIERLGERPVPFVRARMVLYWFPRKSVLGHLMVQEVGTHQSLQ